MKKKQPSFAFVIPARKNSKRVPGKNILKCGNRPLIEWTLDIPCKLSKILKNKKKIFSFHTFITSDDPQIIKLANLYLSKSLPGLNDFSMIKRNPNLAKNKTSMVEVMNDLICKHPDFDYYILLQPTSPLRTADHVLEAISLVIKKELTSLVSIQKISKPLKWIKILSKKNKLQQIMAFNQQPLNQNFVLPNGSIYIVKKNWFQKNQTFSSKETYGYLMPETHSIDIDTPFEFYLADLILKNTSPKGFL